MLDTILHRWYIYVAPRLHHLFFFACDYRYLRRKMRYLLSRFFFFCLKSSLNKLNPVRRAPFNYKILYSSAWNTNRFAAV